MVIEDPSALAFVFVGSRIATDRLITARKREEEAGKARRLQEEARRALERQRQLEEEQKAEEIRRKAEETKKVEEESVTYRIF